MELQNVLECGSLPSEEKTAKWTKKDPTYVVGRELDESDVLVAERGKFWKESGSYWIKCYKWDRLGPWTENFGLGNTVGIVPLIRQFWWGNEGKAWIGWIQERRAAIMEDKGEAIEEFSRKQCILVATRGSRIRGETFEDRGNCSMFVCR